MTIVVAVASPDAIALASDSRTTQRQGAHHRVASDAAQKLFETRGGCGIATYGLATIGEATIASLFEEWDATGEDLSSLADTAASIGRFFQGKLSAATPARRGDLARLVTSEWPLGFLVVGPESLGSGDILEVKVYPDRWDVVDARVRQLVFRGQTGPLRRLIAGVDFEAIKNANITLDAETRDRLSTLHYALIDRVTAQDALDLAWFLVDTTIRMQRFSDGTIASQRAVGRGDPPGCGGQIQALVVRSSGVEWVARTTLSEPVSSEPEPVG